MEKVNDQSSKRRLCLYEFSVLRVKKTTINQRTGTGLYVNDWSMINGVWKVFFTVLHTRVLLYRRYCAVTGLSNTGFHYTVDIVIDQRRRHD